MLSYSDIYALRSKIEQYRAEAKREQLRALAASTSLRSQLAKGLHRIADVLEPSVKNTPSREVLS